MINIANRDNACELAKLAIKMWKDNSIDGLTEEFIRLIEKDDAQIFIKFVKNKAVGFAQELLSECQKWAKKKGCQEFASDCELDNITSFKFHMAMVFEEANGIICFTKKL